ncbi:odorant receptor 67a-like [Leptidea sinapis]|uniref:odorant receptor 67a-like n=1 Tax=Leptidea sinapis TaxID=189913 RepID=UPI0021C3BDF4|nr:odorant receptor 67a-like [Leptidea sinapis]
MMLNEHFPEIPIISYLVTTLISGLDPVFQTPNYQIAFTLTAMGVFFTTYLTSNISALLIVLIGYTESYMLALSTELVNLWEDAKTYEDGIANKDNETNEMGDRNIRLNRYIRKQLAGVVKDHTTHIDLIRKIESVFRGALAIEFLLLIVSLIAELLGGLENTYLELPFALMSVAIDCLMGQKLMDACEVFNDAIYDCKWENFDLSNMKVVLLMMKNSQKSLKISAGGVTTLSFTSLMAVLKSIYSAYTTLRTTM